MRRIFWLLATVGLLVSLKTGTGTPEVTPLHAAERVALKDQLEAGLKARLPAEFAFIGRVVAKVDAGKLPRSLVDSTFLWAREKEKKSSRIRSYQYFERGLKLRAARIGVNL